MECLSSAILTHMSLKRQIQRVIRELMAEAKMSPEEFADDTKVSRATIYRIENSRPYAPGADVIEKILAARSISLREFFDRVEGRLGYSAGEHADNPMTTPAGAGVGLVRETATGYPVPAQVELYGTLIRAFLDAAIVARRSNARAQLEELAVAFATAADRLAPGERADEIKRQIMAARGE